jgi:hypothetical protein
MAISEVLMDEAIETYESLTAVVQGAWRLEGIKLCTPHRLDRRIKQFSIFFPSKPGQISVRR